MLPDIDSLALFVKAAEMRNLTRAAEACFITVPAASRRLSLLEHQFKSQLFERHSRGLQLTPAGEHLLKHAREVIASVHHMRAEMGNYASGRHAVLRILGNTSAMAQFLPSDTASFQAQHEDVRIVLEESWSDEVVRRVRSGEADLGVVVGLLFLGKLYAVPMPATTLAMLVFTATLLSYSVPGLPSASLFLLSPVLAQHGIPVEGVGILIAVDAIPDMFKTTANVTAHLASTVVVARIDANAGQDKPAPGR